MKSFEGYKLKSVTLRYEWLGNVRFITVPIVGECDATFLLGPRVTNGDLRAANKIARKVRKWFKNAKVQTARA